MRWDIGIEERRRIRGIELVNLEFEVFGVTKASRPTAQQADRYIFCEELVRNSALLLELIVLTFGLSITNALFFGLHGLCFDTADLVL